MLKQVFPLLIFEMFSANYVFRLIVFRQSDGLRQLLHNPDLLHNYNPDETYQHLFDLLKK